MGAATLAQVSGAGARRAEAGRAFSGPRDDSASQPYHLVMRRRRPRLCVAAVALGGLAGLVLAGCGAARHARTPGTAACFRAPVGLPGGSVIANGAGGRVHIGAVVYVELIESAGYTGAPGFPWRSARSSNAAVLAPLPLCPGGIATLPLALTAFRARAAGTAVLSAPLTRGLGRGTTRFRPYRATVTVVT